jgi:hypothetical protein
MDLKKCGITMYDLSKLFNNLAQYAPEKVDTDSKNKAHFMRGLSTKLKECLALNVAPRVSNPHDYVNHMFKRP